MGTAAAECCQERPGDGASPGASAADQITPERPEERLWLSRTGKVTFERAERAVVNTPSVKEGGTAGRRMRASSLRLS
jgi:hypothetical protein